MAPKRLSPDSWIEAGFAALVAQGPSALKAEALARDLKTTKGSFYWHFKDVPAFHKAMLTRWEDECLERFKNVAAIDMTPTQKLRHLSQAVEKEETISTGNAVEPAVRAWAHGDKSVSETVARVDEYRMTEITSTLSDLGLSNPELARIIYAANLGMAEMSGRDGLDNDEALGTLVDLVLALYS
ncbi:transcriptional regulator, TetR family [Shimia gijangensis]|uniref:Transcriptional regulator, TetR family n=1 Tax=Shimia gijangensis TaxID=1470563 RepID=A0A1M6BKM5_9RHOB|nr:TetR/AcrR family transcriptional regulator [Shimia gijangensis]SHI49226.1 transcriptional regulator, TetR family [Shimia gijangensis]